MEACEGMRRVANSERVLVGNVEGVQDEKDVEGR